MTASTLFIEPDLAAYEDDLDVDLLVADDKPLRECSCGDEMNVLQTVYGHEVHHCLSCYQRKAKKLK